MSLEVVYFEEVPECEYSEDDEEEAVLLQVESVKDENESTEVSEADLLAGLYTSRMPQEDQVMEPGQHQPDGPTHDMVLEPRARASSKQYATLIGFMERHSDIARPPPGGRLWSDRLWQQLVTSLNSVHDGVYKPHEKWKKVWADWKTKTKKKAIGLRKGSAKCSLTVLEKRVLAVMKSAAHRMAELKEKSFCQTPLKLLPPAKVDNVALSVTEKSADANAENAYSEASIGAHPALHSQHPRSPAPHLGRPRPVPAEPDTPMAAQSRESFTNASTTNTYPPSSTHQSTTTSDTTSRSTAPSHPPRPPTATSPPTSRRHLLPRLTLAEALNNFVSIERRRLKLDEIRERNLHALEREKLRLERERLRVERERVDVFRHLAETGQDLLAHFTGSSHNNARD